MRSQQHKVGFWLNVVYVTALLQNRNMYKNIIKNLQ